jgi:hypothetical protein
MKRLLLAVTGTLIVGLALLGTALAHGPGPVQPPSGRVLKIQGGNSADVTIVHLVRGCHNWTDGVRLADRTEVTLRRSGHVTILNQDVDLHRVVQLAGPRIATGGRMMMNSSVKLQFAKRGFYRFKTVTSDMPGMTEMKTVGADYQLVLVVRVK